VVLIRSCCGGRRRHKGNKEKRGELHEKKDTRKIGRNTVLAAIKKKLTFVLMSPGSFSFCRKGRE